MGVDIYGVFQKRTATRCEDVPSDFKLHRDNQLQCWLGRGNTDLRPISSLKGFPVDFTLDEFGRHPVSGVEAAALLSATGSGDLFPGVLMGEWGFSWLLASEILGAPAPRADMTFSVPIDEFRQWDRVSMPSKWIGKLEVLTARLEEDPEVATPDAITVATQYVLVHLNYDFTADFGYFVDEIRRLQQCHGDVRFVFGFA